MRLPSALGFSRHLPDADRAIFRQTLLLLPAARLLLRLLGFRRALGLAGRLGRRRPAPAVDLDSDAERIAQVWRLAAGRAGAGGNCLSQSLSLWWLLQRHGIDSDLQIGVRTERGRLQAHAWVERLGRPLNDNADSLSQYAAFEGLAVPKAAEWA